MPVEDVDVVLSMFVVALFHDVIPTSIQVTVGQWLVIGGQISFLVQVHLSQLQHHI